MPWISGAIIGGAGLVGSMMSSDANEDAASAAQFRPYKIGLGAGGNADFTNGNAYYTGTDETFQANTFLQQLARDRLRSSPTAGVQNQAYQMGAGGFSPAFLMMDQAYGLAPQQANGMLAQYGNQMGGISDFLGYNNLSARNLAIDPSRNWSVNAPAWNAINQAQGMLGDNYQSTIDNTYANLTAQAKRPEQQAVNSTIQNLFQRGTLGSSSGARMMGELSMAQGQADLQRQMAAEQAGMQRFGANQQYGQGLLGQGMQGLLSGQGANTQLANVLGQLGLQTGGTQADMSGMLYNAGVSNLDANLGRMGQRFTNLQSLFGFGNALGTEDINMANAALGGSMAINTDARNTIALGGNLGGAQAQAGANQAQYLGESPLGAFLSAGATSGVNKWMDKQFPT